jgi:hypothetical protein
MMTTIAISILAGAVLFGLAGTLGASATRGCTGSGCGACGGACKLLEADDEQS